MSKKSSRSEKQTDIWGNQYIQHYDDNNNPVGKSKLEKDLWGNKYVQHYDNDGNETGRSKELDDIWGNEYTQHYDENNKEIGRSKNEKDIWGNEYKQHYNEKGLETGHSKEEEDIWGNQYTSHTGSVSSGVWKTLMRPNFKKMAGESDETYFTKLAIYLGVYMTIFVVVMYLIIYAILIGIFAIPFYLIYQYYKNEKTSHWWLTGAGIVSGAYFLDLAFYSIISTIIYNNFGSVGLINPLYFIYLLTALSVFYLSSQNWIFPKYEEQLKGTFLEKKEYQKNGTVAILGFVFILFVIMRSGGEFGYKLYGLLKKLFSIILLILPVLFTVQYFRTNNKKHWQLVIGGIMSGLLCLDMSFLGNIRGAFYDNDWNIVYANIGYYFYLALTCSIIFILIENFLLNKYKQKPNSVFSNTRKRRGLISAFLGVFYICSIIMYVKPAFLFANDMVVQADEGEYFDNSTVNKTGFEYPEAEEWVDIELPGKTLPILLNLRFKVTSHQAYLFDERGKKTTTYLSKGDRIEVKERVNDVFYGSFNRNGKEIKGWFKINTMIPVDNYQRPLDYHIDHPSMGFMYSQVEDLLVRSAPDRKATALDKLQRNEEVEFMSLATSFSTTVSLNGSSITRKWYKIKTKRGNTGWVHGCCISR